jgi:aldehyde:ferredoxin oxidoreductase
MKPAAGYLGKVLRVDLSAGQAKDEVLADALIEKYVGGTGIGAKILYDEVPPGVEWNDPKNRLILFSGPMGATRISGTGTFSVVTKGPMTNGAGCSQANGLFGAYLKLAGFDGVVVQGAASHLVYLYIHDGKAEIRDARHLQGKGTFETEEILRKELGLGFRGSVQAIGPAGENLVRFAMISGDGGHVVAHNGMGAVMGSKRLKAIVAARGKAEFPVADKAAVEKLTRELHEDAKTKGSKRIYEWGTGGGFSGAALGGWLPIKNYTTGIFPEHEKLDGQYIRTHFKMKDNPCWACQLRHCKLCEVTEGPYKGFKGEEPEYEGLAAWGSVIGNADAGATVMLNWFNDEMGMDLNEAGWVVGWAMECYEKGVFTQKDLGGLAEGVKRASEKTGGEAAKWAIYTHTGAAPRGHDHRGRLCEMLDTCTSNTSTIEATRGGVYPERMGYPPVFDKFSPWEVAAVNAKENGWLQFVDCLGVCAFCCPNRDLTVKAANAVMGGNLDLKSATHIGLRIVNLLRVFNFRHGLDPKNEKPSFRYSEIPKDGPNKGRVIQPHFDFMVRIYRELMGWEPDTGRPLPQTLKAVGLEELIEKF